MVPPYYEFDLEAALADGYRHLCLEAYDRQWLDFISASRHSEEPWYAPMIHDPRYGLHLMSDAYVVDEIMLELQRKQG